MEKPVKISFCTTEENKFDILRLEKETLSFLILLFWGPNCTEMTFEIVRHDNLTSLNSNLS